MRARASQIVATVAATVVVTSCVGGSVLWAGSRVVDAPKDPRDRPADVSDADCVDVAGMVWNAGDDPYMLGAPDAGSGYRHSG